jgi:hypothetical protein
LDLSGEKKKNIIIISGYKKKKMTEKEKTNASQTWERITQRAVGGISYIIL